jgi:2-polyprenyl-6-methoxyphenol hydroxylase-like FAD-dependent oxidoreductase
MTQAYRVGIVGFGVGGGALACLLARAGHQVTLFERATQVGPAGTGLLLQPSGQGVLRRMGLLEPILAQSEAIHELHALQPDGRTLVHLRYGDLAPGCCAYGVHRGTLFAALRATVEAERVQVCLNHTVTAWERRDGGVYAVDATGQQNGPYDLLVAADGARSALRQAFAPRLVSEPYAYGAMWMVGQCTQVRNHLHQIVRGNHVLFGLLPIGGDRCTLFWGLRRDRMEEVRANGFAAWREELVRLCPLAEEPLANAEDFSHVVFTDYRHTLPARCHNDSVVLLGDAAHAMSPHLGQGANLALMDAECLAHALLTNTDLQEALRSYARLRRASIRYYALLSRLLTPFFQSNLALLGFGRDLALPLMTRIPPLRRQMLLTVTGLKTGPFANCAQETLAPDRPLAR